MNLDHRLFDPQLLSGIFAYTSPEQYLENLVDVLNGTEDEQRLIQRVNQHFRINQITYIPFSQQVLDIIDRFYQLGYEELCFELIGFVIEPEHLSDLFVAPEQLKGDVANVVVIHTRSIPIELDIYPNKNIVLNRESNVLFVFNQTYYKVSRANIFTDDKITARFGNADSIAIGLIPTTFAYDWFLTKLGN